MIIDTIVEKLCQIDADLRINKKIKDNFKTNKILNEQEMKLSVLLH
jgi:hypothetical protein